MGVDSDCHSAKMAISSLYLFSSLCLMKHMILKIHFTEEKAQALRDCINFPWSYSYKEAGKEIEFRFYS